MKKDMVETTAKEYLEKVENGSISLDVSVQRRDDQWSLAQKSSLIESMMKGYPIPAICVVTYEGTTVVIDGLQRTTAIKGFYNDEYALEGVEESLSGKKFSELDAQNQQMFCEYRLSLMDGGVVSGKELIEVFLRLNNGTALSKTQKTRGFLGISVAKWAKEMCEHPLFTKMASFTARQLRDDAPLECLLQGIMLIHACLGDDEGNLYPWKNISRNEVQKYGRDILSKVSQKQLDGYAEVIKYLDSADVTHNYEKTFIPALIVLGKYAMMSGVSNQAFNEYLVHMRTNLPVGYGEFTGAGNVSKAKTVGRIKILINDFNSKFTELKKPEINLDASRKNSAKKVTNSAGVQKKSEEKAEEVPASISSSDANDNVPTGASEQLAEDRASGSTEADAETVNDVSDGTEADEEMKPKA